MSKRVTSGQLAGVLRLMALQEPGILADYLEDRLPDTLADKADLLGAVRANCVLVELTMSPHTPSFDGFLRLGSCRLEPKSRVELAMNLNALSKQYLKAVWRMRQEYSDMHGVPSRILRDAVPDMHATRVALKRGGRLCLWAADGCQWTFRSDTNDFGNRPNPSLFALVWLIYGWSWKGHPEVVKFLDMIEREG